MGRDAKLCIGIWNDLVAEYSLTYLKRNQEGKNVGIKTWKE